MKQSDRSVIFEVIGGIGNQLFGLSAAVYFQEVRNTKVKVSLREVDKGITAHGTSIVNFELPYTFVEQDYIQNFTTKNLRRAVNKLDRMLHANGLFSRKFLKLYRSPGTGFDKYLEEAKGINRIQGYFQSQIYAEYLVKDKSIAPFQVKVESQWLKNMKTKALSEKPIMLHVRRGDYRNQLDDFGMLGVEYYENGISYMRKVYPHNPLWVFSDDIFHTQEDFKDIKDENLHWITPPIDSIAEETLVLMQYGIAHIISNSTFSWWAAYASNTSEVIVAPQPWMRTIIEPKTLIPEDWIRVSSSWI